MDNALFNNVFVKDNERYVGIGNRLKLLRLGENNGKTENSPFTLLCISLGSRRDKERSAVHFEIPIGILLSDIVEKRSDRLYFCLIAADIDKHIATTDITLDCLVFGPESFTQTTATNNVVKHSVTRKDGAVIIIRMDFLYTLFRGAGY